VSAARFRAWRFLYPGVDASGDEAGLCLSASGGIAMVQGDDSVRQALLLLISTIPGERVMRPDYGCHLTRLVFSPNDDTTAGLAIYYVRDAIDRCEPRIVVVHLDAERNEESPERLNIVLDYRVRSTHRVDSLAFAFDLTGGES
jgi:phage baseplate assembly protein W